MGAAVEGITVGFEEFAGRHEDEAPVAAAIAAHYGLPHHVAVVSRAEFEQDIPRILDAMDQPSIDGVNTWFASKAAAERGYKVVLSGVGGDELFCGYSSFRQIPPQAAAGEGDCSDSRAPALLGVPCAYLAKSRSQPKLAGVPALHGFLGGRVFPAPQPFPARGTAGADGSGYGAGGSLRLGGSPPGMTQTDARDGAAAVGLLESTLYLRNQLLRDSDWASMGHSLELRTPLVDAQLLASLGPYSARFKSGIGKSMLARCWGKPLSESLTRIAQKRVSACRRQSGWPRRQTRARGSAAPCGLRRKDPGPTLGRNSHWGNGGKPQ